MILDLRYCQEVKNYEWSKKKEVIRLSIDGMTCDSCAVHVRNALASVVGMKLVELQSWEDESARVIIEDDVTDEQLKATLKEAGYKASVESRNAIVDDLVLPVEPKTRGYDLVVIGTGSAGVAASIKAAELGFKVALIERGEIGGTSV